MATRTHKIRKASEDPVTKLERSIVTDAKGNKFPLISEVQTGRKEFVLIDAPTFTGEDNKAGSKARTLRRKSRVERLLAAKVIEPHHARALQWYADQHEAGFATLGITANYGGTGGGGFACADLLARNVAQSEARGNYFWARNFIPHDLRDGFESVVIGHADLIAFPANGNSERTRFRNRRAAFLLACNMLHTAVEKMTG